MEGNISMILVINICKEKLHYLEFVKPIEDTIKKTGIKFNTKHYISINSKDLKNADKIIICGTSLKDNCFIEDIKRFEWIRNYDKPVLGICGGMQIIGSVFLAKIGKKTEIGLFKEKFIGDFLGINAGSEEEVYHLHNFFIELPKGFLKLTDSKIPQAIKHKEKLIYGTLFHPEVRQKKIIEEFLKI